MIYQKQCNGHYKYIMIKCITNNHFNTFEYNECKMEFNSVNVYMGKNNNYIKKV